MTSLLQAVQEVLQRPQVREPGAWGDRITWETVEQRRADGTHIVLGRILPVTGLQTFPVGARVAVVWKGGQPIVILGHRWRRAQFHGAFRLATTGIVEELFIASLTRQSRNHTGGTILRVLGVR